MGILYFLLLIGVLVFVHEFGHYIAARIFHVKVLNFSIGFGPRIGGFTRGGTQWDIRLLPLGGYVQMYGNDFEEITDKSDPDYANAYNNKPIWQKAIINFAGPLLNLLFPIPILFLVFVATSTTDLPPQIGQVLNNSPAFGVLEPGDVITKIGDTEVEGWSRVQEIISDNPGEELKFTIIRNGVEKVVTITPEEAVIRDAMDIMKETKGRIGVTPDPASSVIGITSTTGLAATYGLQTFDEIAEINGIAVHTYVELEQALAQNSKDELRIRYLRPSPLSVAYGDYNLLVPNEVVIPKHITTPEELGIASDNMFLTDIDADSPADKAGLKKGDCIVELDGEKMSVFRSFVDKLTVTWEDPHELTIRRGDEIFKTTLQLERIKITGEFQEEVPIIYSGFYHSNKYVIPETIEKSGAERFRNAAKKSFILTVKCSTMLAVYIGKMFQGKGSTKDLGGPIMIGHMAAKAGSEGFDTFLRMLAVISINLGVINLVPIPLLDGGKLAILLVEAIKRGPISMRARQIVMYIGLALVLLLLMLAFKNDIERVWNLFFS